MVNISLTTYNLIGRILTEGVGHEDPAVVEGIPVVLFMVIWVFCIRRIKLHQTLSAVPTALSLRNEASHLLSLSPASPSMKRKADIATAIH